MMVKPLKTLLVGASVLAGATVLATPASAITFTTGGTRPVELFCAVGGVTSTCPATPSAIANELSTTSGSGNLELNQVVPGDIDDMTLGEFQAQGANAASLTVDFEDGGSTEDVVFESLTFDDWFTGPNALAPIWFAGLLDAYQSELDTGIATLPAAAQAALLPNAGGLGDALNQTVFSALLFQGGTVPGLGTFNGIAQRLSDPNIAYVQQKPGGGFAFGLAGFDSASNLLDPDNDLEAALIPIFANVAFSEVVKVIANGETSYAYSFGPGRDSGVVADDGVSHTKTFDFDPSPSESVPEPATLLGLLAVGGLFAASKRKANAA